MLVYQTLAIIFIVISVSLIFLIFLSWRVSRRPRCPRCPHIPALVNCTNQNFPVLNGIDVVSFWDNLPQKGSPIVKRVFKGYTYMFFSEENAMRFDKSPTRYMPQFCGFCSWGMSNETHPEFVWSPRCLGPSISLNAWLIYEDKLYLFLHSIPMLKFCKDISLNIQKGESRMWNWYGDDGVKPMNTTCTFPDYNNIRMLE
jgi:hypothetical protein